MNDTLLYGLTTIGVGFLALVVRYTFKSKCSNVSLCFGCVSIKRNINAEMELEENGIGTPTKRQQSFDEV